MKTLISLVAMLALIGFVGTSHAADAKPPKAHNGHVVKIDDKELTFKGGLKGTGKDHTVTIDDKTKFTIDGKDVTMAEAIKELKEGEYVEVTADKQHVASLIAASTVTPTTKPTTKPSETTK